MNALRVVFRNWINKYSDGHALVKDLEPGGEKIVYRDSRKGNLYGELTLGFGKYKGRAIKDVPISYLLWVLDNFEDLWPQTRQGDREILRVVSASCFNRPGISDEFLTAAGVEYRTQPEPHLWIPYHDIDGKRTGHWRARLQQPRPDGQKYTQPAGS